MNLPPAHSGAGSTPAPPGRAAPDVPCRCLEPEPRGVNVAGVNSSSTHQRSRFERYLSAHVGVILAVAVILYGTLWPFQLVWPRVHSIGQYLARYDWAPISKGGAKDFSFNILLFLPLGFTLASLLASRPRGRRLAIIAIVCCVLSAWVETVQVLLPLRDPSLSDIIANIVGGLVGCGLYVLAGPKCVSTSAALFVRRDSGQVSVARFGAAVGLWLAVLLAGLILGGRSMRISNWSAGYTLSVGNEATGDRPWRGAVARVRLSNRHLSAGAASNILNGGDLPAEGVVADYRLVASPKISDATNHLPPLVRRGGFDKSDPTAIAPRHWLKTVERPDALLQAVRATNELTIVIDAASADPKQGTNDGPARMLSYAPDTRHQNFTVGQSGDKLVVRMRMPASRGGNDPAIVVDDVFTDKAAHRIVISLSPIEAAVYIDRPENVHRMDLRPSGAMWWRGRLPTIAEVRLRPATADTYDVLFLLAALVPIGVLLGLPGALGRGRSLSVDLALAAAAGLIAALGVVLVGRSPPQLKMFGAAIVISILSLLIFRVRVNVPQTETAS